jgi:hypothetical protein
MTIAGRRALFAVLVGVGVVAAGAPATAAEVCAPTCVTGHTCVGGASVVEPTPRLIAIPYLGVNSVQGGEANAGLRVGALLGGRVSEAFSLNGELTIDQIKLGADASAYVGQFSFSPLFQAQRFDQRLVVGPKVGYWVGGEDSSSTSAARSDTSGWILGVNLGLFLRVKETTGLGILANWSTGLRHDQILGFTLAVMFDLLPSSQPPAPLGPSSNR